MSVPELSWLLFTGHSWAGPGGSLPHTPGSLKCSLRGEQQPEIVIVGEVTLGHQQVQSLSADARSCRLCKLTPLQAVHQPFNASSHLILTTPKTGVE